METDIFATLKTAVKHSQRRTTLMRTSESTSETNHFVVPILAVELLLPGLDFVC